MITSIICGAQKVKMNKEHVLFSDKMFSDEKAKKEEKKIVS